MEKKLSPTRIASVYALFGAIWILVSDRVAGTIFSTASGLFMAQTLKGLLYVGTTSGLVYVLVLRAGRGIERDRAWYRNLFDHNPRPMWIFDRDTLAFLDVNEAAIAQYGYSREEFLRMTVRDIRPPEDFEAFLAARPAISEGTQPPGVWRHRLRNGSHIQVEISFQAIRFADRNAVMVLADNVTARLEGEDRIRAMIACSPLALVNIDDVGLVREWNASAEQMFGWTAEEVVGRPLPLVPYDMQDEFFELRERVLAGETISGIEISRRRKDGSRLDVRLSAASIRDAGNRATGILTVMEDITREKEIESELREAQQRNRLILNSVGEGLLALDTQGVIEGSNPAARAMLGWSEEELTGGDLNDLLVPHRAPGGIEPGQECVVFRTLRDGLPRRAEDEFFFTRDGAGIPVEYSCAPLVNSAGGITGAVVSFRDISARLEAEESLRRSQALLRMASRVSRTGAWVADLRLQELTWSDEVRALHEVGPDFEPTVENALSFYPPEHRDAIQTAFEECSLRGTPFNEELQIVTAKGRRIWVRAMGEAVREGRSIVRVQGALQDLSECKDAEHRLEQSRRRFHQLADSMHLVVWTGEPDGRITYANRAFTDYTGIPIDDALPMRWVEAVHPDDRESCAAVRREALRTGEPYEIEFRLHRAQDGAYRWHLTRAVPIRDDAGDIAKWHGTTTDIHESRQAQEAASRLAERLTTTLESITDGFMTLDADWRFTYINGQAEKMMERDRAELIGKEIWAVFPDAAGTPFQREFTQAMESGNTSSFEAHYPAFEKWYAVRAYPSEAGVAVYFRDVTERRREREALRESQHRLAALLDNLPGMAYRCRLDEDFTMLFASEGVVALTGYAPEDLLHNARVSYAEVTLPQDRERVYRTMRDAADRNVAFEMEYGIRTREGLEKQVWERGRFFPGEDGQGYLEGFIMDVTVRKRAEAERERLNAAIDQLAEIVLITDPAGAIQYVNTAFERVTGYSREEAVGRNSRFLKSGVHSTEMFRDMYQTLLTGRTWRGRLVNKRKDGTLFTEDSIISPVFDDQGTLAHYICVKNDVTGQLALEEQYRQAQKMEAVGRLAGGVAHDFNNMLTVILVRAELALRRLGPEDRLAEPLHEIHQAAQRSADLTRQLLTYARRQAVEPRVLAPNDAIEGMLKMLRRLIGENVELRWVPGRDPWPVKIDPAQLDQLVTNLCVNARDAIPNVGRILLETRNVVMDENACRNRPGASPGSYVMLSVSDNGTGMDKATLALIFEPFFTTKEVGKGTGLGLATVYGIVKQNNGFVNVYSEPGEGTTFHVYLPRHADPGDPELSAGREESAPPGARGETVLLVEDEPMILASTAEILRGLGYRVLEASRPSEALREAERHGADIDLVLTDVIMPEMNGRELLEKLRAKRPEVKSLFMSGYTANVIVPAGGPDQGSPFIQKPFSMHDLAVKVREALDAMPAERGA